MGDAWWSDWVLKDLDFVFCYMDDILVASESEEQHKKHLNVLFDCLESHGLVVKPAKCVFGVTSINFLDHRLDAKGLTPLPARVDAITAFPRPKTVKSVQEFIGIGLRDFASPLWFPQWEAYGCRCME